MKKIKYNVNDFITEQQAKDILSMLRAGESHKYISISTGLSENAVKQIIQRLIWPSPIKPTATTAPQIAPFQNTPFLPENNI